MAGVTHYITTKSGDTYTGRDGQEKEGYVQIGKMVETAKGNKIIIIEAIPLKWNSATGPVALYLKDARANGDTEPATPPPRPKPVNLDDDLPF